MSLDEVGAEPVPAVSAVCRRWSARCSVGRFATRSIGLLSRYLPECGIHPPRGGLCVG